MDVRIAIITGTAFAGVLVAGALAAPRGGSDSNTEDTTTVLATDANGELVSLPAILSYYDDEEDDDDRYEDDDDDDDHDDHREHDDDEDEDDD
ncbi:MAG: hypothetical protein IH609_00450 [Dehalococcoidia bacterium]|nr:hypothetical protein [Dehalococcoidia bacterium]